MPPRPHRPDRERIGLPVSEYLWLRLLDRIDDDQERELREQEGSQAWLDYQDRYGGDGPFGYFLDEGLSPEVFDEALAAFIVENPGRRPRWWWWSSLTMELHKMRHHDAHAPHLHAPLTDLFPRLFDNKAERRPLFADPRRRLGGKGTTPWDAGLAVVPRFEYGIPIDWEKDASLWTLIGTQPPVDFVPFDPAAPPKYESQAAYLKRHGLLFEAEARRLHPRDFKPERVGAEVE